jgi:hypothetical protein
LSRFLIFLDKSSEFLAERLEGIRLSERGKFFESLGQRFQLPVFVEPPSLKRYGVRTASARQGLRDPRANGNIGQVNLDEIEKTFSSAAFLRLFQAA